MKFLNWESRAKDTPEPTVSREDLEEKLKKSSDNNRVLREKIEGLKGYLEETRELRKNDKLALESQLKECKSQLEKCRALHRYKATQAELERAKVPGTRWVWS